ncbi:MAG: hypothetical protein AUI12_13430 [Acidobacteria bacterium 13_2_20CM_2_57_6]|nr:MAG: hypothetical protein AUI12_13430 [Acidobacteria bacterium 13_2_20CM_2_57_6]
MAQVYPFRAFRYNPKQAPFDRVLTQPYDKISPAMQGKYYAADPHNLIAVEKGRAYPSDTPQNNVYTRAAAAMEDWILKQVVVQDPAPSFYGYTQEYTVPDTEERRTRRGFIGAGTLEEYSAGVVFRHEHTLSGPKADRLELLRHTKTHTGQLFMLYSDAEKRIDALLADAETAAAPVTEMRDEYGVMHRLWVIAEPQRLAAIQKAMADQKLVIADGHHRYETALNYRNERRGRGGKIDPEAPYERAMMMFINTRSEGLTILPTHRLAANVHDFSWSGVRRHLEPWFAAEEFPFSGSGERSEAKKKFLAKLAKARAKRAIGVYPTPGGKKRAFYVLTLREGVNLAQLLPNVSPLQRELDVVLLHEGILEPALGITPQAVKAEENLTYEREALAALDAVDSGRAQVSFLLNPCDVEQVMKIATSGEVMPQKSTDFYPKLMSGITMYRLET